MMHLFFSYSHKDENLRNELEKHLTILKRSRVIDAWHDRQIDSGQVIDNQVSIHLKSANVILLLVSSDFLASDYCYDIEMKEAMEMHEAGLAIVIPVILRPCDWHGTPFGKLLAVPTDGKAVTLYSNVDEAFLDITQAIKKSIKSLSGMKSVPIEAPLHLDPSKSTNLKVFKKITDYEKDVFIDHSFEVIGHYFKSSLIELKKNNPHIESKFQQIDSKKFTAGIYADGKLKSECMIFIGGISGRSKSISFSFQISSSMNSLNESLTLIEDGSQLWLMPLGMQLLGSPIRNLSVAEAAEYYWSLALRPLQRNY